MLGLGLVLVVTGCTSINTEMVKPDGTKVTMNAHVPLWANGILKNLKLDSATKTTSALLTISGASVEPNVDSITATGEAMGNFVGTIMEKTAKGVK